MDGIRSWIEAEGTGHWFFVAFPVVLVCLFIWFKGRRVRFLIPSLIISIVIINPVFFKYWDELGLYAYWRILWVIPVIPVVAGLVPSMSEKTEKPLMKSMIAAAGIGLTVFCGTFLYNGAAGSFVEAANAVKLPDNLVAIADRILELGDHSRIIGQDPIGVYIRQYTGEIDTLFGRDIGNSYIYEPSTEAVLVHRTLNDPESKRIDIAQYMLDDGFDYLVYNGELGTDFGLVERIGGYGLYKPVGDPTVIKERNELGQVLSITSVDENGNPVNNENGFSTISYNYDNNGFVNRIFATDRNGNGISGEEREFDSAGRVVKNYSLNADGKRYLSEAGYYGYSQEFDETGKRISRIYIDESGKSVNRTEGFSKVSWEEINGVKGVAFYDTNGNKIDAEGINLMLNQNGNWSEWMKPKYDVVNHCINFGSICLDDKMPGVEYSCQIEIEFKDVTVTEGQEFRFWTQGMVDGMWSIGNIWNTKLVWIGTVPEEGVHSFSCTSQISKEMSKASIFDIGFRCDNWASGSFRVRKIKVERGSRPTEWSNGL